MKEVGPKTNQLSPSAGPACICWCNPQIPLQAYYEAKFAGDEYTCACYCGDYTSIDWWTFSEVMNHG